MKPPLPPAAPPWALMLPPKAVCWSLHTITRPPSPCAVASAFTLVKAFSVVLRALGTAGLLPWKSPPMRTWPPPCRPLASICAAYRSIWLAVSCTLPPVAPVTSTVALLNRVLAVPLLSLPLTWTLPPCPRSLRALSLVPCVCCTCPACSVICPPAWAPSTLARALWPSRSVLTLMAPPNWPSARTAPSSKATWAALTATLPPCVCPLASSVPPWNTLPASSTMRPPRPVRLLAFTLPLLWMTPPCSSCAAWADMSTVPPGASTACRLSTRAARADGATRSRVSCWPANCSSMTSPAARATVPAWASSTPSLRTSGASRAM